MLPASGTCQTIRVAVACCFSSLSPAAPCRQTLPLCRQRVSETKQPRQTCVFDACLRGSVVSGCPASLLVCQRAAEPVLLVCPRCRPAAALLAAILRSCCPSRVHLSTAPALVNTAPDRFHSTRENAPRLPHNRLKSRPATTLYLNQSDRFWGHSGASCDVC